MREEAGIQVPIKGSYRNVAFRLYFACDQKKVVRPRGRF